MKVKDLIVKLLEISPEADVSFQISDGCCGDYDELGEPDLDEVPYSSRPDEKVSFVNFRFPALPHMSSCIASGIAKRAVERHRTPKTSIEGSNLTFAHAKYIKELNAKKRSDGQEST